LKSTTPVDPGPISGGVQAFCNALTSLDSGAFPGLRSGVRRNDVQWDFLTFCEIVMILFLLDVFAH